jgi:Tol biopolymer transport system component
MSPEQIKGDAVDKRADIWAFGCVLYEMLAGCQAFGGADATTMMARVVDREPDFSLLPANLHPRLRDLLRRCLSKDVKRRYQDIGDVRMDLEAILAGPSGPSVEPVPVPAIGTRSRLPWAVGILAAAVVAGAAAWVLKPMPPIQVHRSQHQLPEGAEFRNRSANVIAVAPGGQFYVYNATGGLYVKKAEDLHAQLIRGTDDVTNPFISPDGRWVGYWHRGRRTIERIAVSGGAPIAIVTATFEPSGISWAPDNTILWAYQNAIFRISLDSENPRQIVDVPQKVLSGPTLLPDGRGVMFTQTDKGWDAGDIVVALLDEKKTQRVVLKGRAARYLPTGHLVYAVGDELLAVRFDLGTLKPISTPVQVASKVLGAGTSDSANYAVTDQGSLVYAAGGPAGGVGDALSLVWVNRDGTETAIDLELAGYSSPRLSPDGTRVAAQVSASTSSYDVWVADLTRQPPTLFKLSHRALDAFPAWALDSQSIVFSSDRDYQKGGARSFFRLRADGTGEPEHLIKITTSARWWAHSFSPNGRLLAFTYDDPKTRGNIGLISLEGVPTARPLIETSAEEHQPVIAPRSGNWIAYASDLNGTQEVYVERFPTLGDRVPISTGGGSSPLWSGDESELFYVRPDGAVMVVPIQHGSKLTPGNAGVLIPAGPYKTIRSTVVNYDYDSRRRRFLMVRSATNTDPQARPRIVTVLSWITEVSERLQAQ